MSNPGNYNAGAAPSRVVLVDPASQDDYSLQSTAGGVAGTDRSGMATTTSGGLSVPANSSRRALTGQNVGTNNIGFRENGGTAVIGQAGTFTVAPGGSFKITTTGTVNFIAATSLTPVTMTET